MLGFLSVTMTGPAGASTCSGCEVAATCEGVSPWGEAAPCERRMDFTPKTATNAMITRPTAAGANRAITEGLDGEAASEMAFCSSDLGATGLDAPLGRPGILGISAENEPLRGSEVCNGAAIGLRC